MLWPRFTLLKGGGDRRSVRGGESERPTVVGNLYFHLQWHNGDLVFSLPFPLLQPFWINPDLVSIVKYFGLCVWFVGFIYSVVVEMFCGRLLKVEEFCSDDNWRMWVVSLGVVVGDNGSRKEVESLMSVWWKVWRLLSCYGDRL